VARNVTLAQLQREGRIQLNVSMAEIEALIERSVRELVELLKNREQE
jgi:hypothetical protein